RTHLRAASRAARRPAAGRVVRGDLSARRAGDDRAAASSCDTSFGPGLVAHGADAVPAADVVHAVADQPPEPVALTELIDVVQHQALVGAALGLDERPRLGPRQRAFHQKNDVRHAPRVTLLALLLGAEQVVEQALRQAHVALDP